MACYNICASKGQVALTNSVLSASPQALLSRETLLSTLARLLREDGPRSLEMATAVAGCFYACSCIKEMHRQLLDNQVRACEQHSHTPSTVPFSTS